MAGQAANSGVGGWLERFGDTALSEDALAPLCDDIDAAIVAAVPPVAADESLRADLRASTRETVRLFIQAVARDTDEEYAVPPEARDLARAFAQRRLDLALLLKVYRVGQDRVWRHLMDAVWADSADEALARPLAWRLWEQMARRLDTSLDALVETYTEERERRLRGALARRTEIVATLLDGRAIDLDDAEPALGHPLRRHQTAFVLWASEGSGDPLALMEDLVAAMSAALGAARPLTLPAGARALWAWVASHRAPDLAPLRELTAADGAHAAAGTTGFGADGFRASHREALRAQRVAIAGSEARTVTLYRDVELVSLVSSDPEAMRALVARELGGLAARDQATARLRQTALAYLRAGGNARIAAAALGTHKNTVLYRLGSIETLLGRPTDERRLQLEIALTTVETFGESALPDTDQ